MSWKPEMLVGREWCSNSLRFATKAEAEASGMELLQRWTLPVDYRATESDAPVNYRFDFERQKTEPTLAGSASLGTP